MLGRLATFRDVAHQIGGALRLGVLVAVFAAADAPSLDGPALLAHRIAVALTGGAVLLSVSLALVLGLTVRPPGPGSQCSAS